MLSGLVLSFFSTCTCEAITISLPSELGVWEDAPFPPLENNHVGLRPLEASWSSDTCEIHVQGEPLKLSTPWGWESCALPWQPGSVAPNVRQSLLRYRLKGVFSKFV